MSVGFLDSVAKTQFSSKMSLFENKFFFKRGSKDVMEIRAALKNLSHLFALNTW